MSTLHKKKKDGGWDLINMKAKGRALFLHRMRTQSLESVTVTSEWIRSWDLESLSNNSPCRDRIPPVLEYLRRYAMDAAYVPLQGSSESLQTDERRIYDTLPMNVGPFHHDIAGPRVADGGTASNMEGSCE